MVVVFSWCVCLLAAIGFIVGGIVSDVDGSVGVIILAVTAAIVSCVMVREALALPALAGMSAWSTWWSAVPGISTIVFMSVFLYAVYVREITTGTLMLATELQRNGLIEEARTVRVAYEQLQHDEFMSAMIVIVAMVIWIPVMIVSVWRLYRITYRLHPWQGQPGTES